MWWSRFQINFRNHRKIVIADGLTALVGGLNIGEVTELTTADALEHFRQLALSEFEEQVAGRVLEEIRKRLQYLVEVGLDYLTLDRTLRTLSGGEGQRVALTSALGSSLVHMLYVLDEPSIGLHQRDNERLLKTLTYLRDLGNTVIVVEHDEDAIRRADHVVDIACVPEQIPPMRRSDLTQRPVFKLVDSGQYHLVDLGHRAQIADNPLEDGLATDLPQLLGR